MRNSRTEQRLRRHRRLRKKVVGTPERPRLSVHRTLHHIYAIVVDDSRGHTLVAASTREKSLATSDSRTNVDAARRVGEAIGQKAKAVGITAVVFDTSGLKYHGRVKALADAARAAGLEF
ncbi:MAG: 50S ribosomal protein L18 [Vulcanimicrobiaceae bacterium]